MKDIESKSLSEISNADYARDLAQLASDIERQDWAALERRKENSFGAALHRRVFGQEKRIRQ